MPRKCPASSINQVAGHRGTHMPEMDADLVGASGFRATLNQVAAITGGDGSVCSFRLPSTFALRDDHALTMHRMARDPHTHDARFGTGKALGDGKVSLFHITLGELPGQCRMRCVRFCNHETPAGFLIQPMDNPGAGRPAEPGESSKPVCKRIGNRSRVNSRSWMHNHSRRLIHDGKGRIFKKHHQREVLRLGRRVGRRRISGIHVDPVASPNFRRRGGFRSVDPDRPGSQKPLHFDSRQTAASGGNQPIDPLPGIFRRDFDRYGIDHFRCGGILAFCHGCGHG